MVSYINSTRKAGDAKVEHYDFLKKVPQVLGGGAGNFSGSYKSLQNKAMPMYNFPKREAMLMAMSYGPIWLQNVASTLQATLVLPLGFEAF
jgi:hypothetical protein